ncbi:MAG: hypothetical protein RBT06_09650 [Smithellaceae bacterium]|jgi:hypothetical protein|nr:hypothetical protein [Smithellaceae bacterium]
MKFYSEKIIRLKNADIHLHYANNKGRGDNNVTVTIVNSGTMRPGTTREYEDYIRQYRVSGWKGTVNIRNEEMEKYGGLAEK